MNIVRVFSFFWVVQTTALVFTLTANAQKDIDVGITDGIGMKLNLISAGKFKMGSESADKLAKISKLKSEVYLDETPSREISISKDFYIGTFEVTKGQFGRFIEATGYRTECEGQDGVLAGGLNKEKGLLEMTRGQFCWRNTGFEQTNDHPVVNVTWNDANAFCMWLSKKENAKYRLPTEAEWEYACKPKIHSSSFTGNDFSKISMVANLADKEAKKVFATWETIDQNDGFAFTAAVGNLQANSLGLFDMHGNVWEWCGDWYSPNYYSDSPTTDPTGAKRGKYKVYKGGGWSSLPMGCRSAVRNKVEPNSCQATLGFRVVRELEK